MLIADRFLSTASATVDLATGVRVDLRRLPPASRSEECAWNEHCTNRAHRSRGATARLIDYGLLPDGTRFEAYRAPTRRDGSDGSRAVVDGLAALTKQVTDVLATASLGEPRTLRVPTADAPPPRPMVEALARVARISGFVPLLVDLAVPAEERTSRPLSRSSVAPFDEVAELLRTRHVMLIAGAPARCRYPSGCRAGRSAGGCPAALARLIVRVGAQNARPTLLLLGQAAAARCGTCEGENSPGGAGRSALRLVCTPGGRLGSRAAEAHETYRVATCELARLRTRAADALAQIRGPRCQRAEYALRGFAGALARRGDAPGAAWVTLSLGCLLLERGRALEAARAFESAREQFDRAHNGRGAVRATVYLGLAWTDDRLFAEASAALRCSVVAAEEVGAADLRAEARIGLARCLYWQGRFDEASTLLAAMSDAGGAAAADHDSVGNRTYRLDTTDRAAVAREARLVDGWPGCQPPASFERRTLLAADPDRDVRLAALRARAWLASGDVRAAMRQATCALEAATATGQALDLAVAHTACAAVHAALGDADSLVRHVREGIACARQAHAPLRALRLRVLAADALVQRGHASETHRLRRRLATLRPDRFPALLRARLTLVVASPGARTEPRVVACVEDEAARFAIAACPWRLDSRRRDVTQDVVDVLEICHHSEDEEAALAGICAALRERVRAVSVAIVGRGDGAAATLAHAGCAAGIAPTIERVLDTGVAVPPVPTPLGKEAASPVRYAGAAIGVVFVRWTADALPESGRVTAVLSAAAAGAAPHVRSLLDRAHAGRGAADSAELVGVSEGMCALRKAIRRASAAPFPVLIEGESGSGKELVARAIHRESPRRARRFCAVNCAALADDLLEAELFGHARGAFTGAVVERPGLFEDADGGTLFLDEVADLSARAQAKLLRAVQDGEVRRIGENLARSVDARVVAATNRSLEAEAESGAFRRDLFYRLHVVRVDVPPLRERAEDIALLASHFWQQAAARTGSRATLAPATLAALARYHWPGNVRELQNVMAALAVSSPHRGSVGPASLPAIIARREAEGPTLEVAREAFERTFVRAALARAGGHRGRTAVALGMSRQGLAKVMARLGIENA